MKNERRVFVAQELRAAGTPKEPKIEGYAATFGTVADIGTFSEVIQQGAFTRTLAAGDDVMCLFNHNEDVVLGRLSAGTLSLEQDEKGLKFSCSIPETTAARDVYVNLRAGNIKECSFGFFVNGPSGEKVSYLPDGTPLRTLVDVTLLDVSVVTYPAYSGTSAAARNVVAEGVEARMSAVRSAASSHLGSVPFSSYDARSERSYNSADEANGIINWADGEDEDRAADAPVKNKVKAASGFLFVKNAGEKRSDYIGPHHTIVDGELAHSQIGTLRCAMSLATGKLDIPAEARSAAKAHLDSELSVWMGNDSEDSDAESEVERSKARTRLAEARISL